MNYLRMHDQNAPLDATYKAPSYARPFARLLAIALLIASLSTTGCDFVDSNAEREASDSQSHLQETSYTLMQTAGKRDTFSGPPVPVDPFWHDLLGSWEFSESQESADKKRWLPVITFTPDRRVRVETVCSTHEGPFFSQRPGELTIPYLALVHQTCNLLIEEPLTRMLTAATAYKVEDGRLFISITRHQTLLFNAVARTDIN